MTVFTIGYEGLSVATFTALLIENQIDTIVDVRELPLSRKPGFSKNSLANHLTLSSIAYLHMVNLGCPKSVRDAFKEDRDWGRYTRGFIAHLQEQESAINELSALAKSSSCALLCYEADYRNCHRSMVATAVSEVSGLKVKHIQAFDFRKEMPAASHLVAA